MASHKSQSTRKSTGVSRRKFMRTAASAAATGASVMIVPRYVLGQGMTPPSDLVNIAVVGVSGRGAAILQGVMSQNIVAVCDVDFGLLDNRLAAWLTCSGICTRTLSGRLCACLWRRWWRWIW